MRKVLVATARKLASREGGFSIKRVCSETGLDRKAFNSCFASKQALIAAIVEGDVETLGAIAAVVSADGEQRPQAAPATAAPPVDQWLERRLRVFERAVAGLESRQEKTERELALKVAELEEKIAALTAAPAPAAAAQPAPVADIDPPAAPEEMVVAAPSGEFESPQVPAEFALPETEAPVSETDVADFLAQARAAAIAASQAAPPQPALALPRWIAWMGVVTVTLVICAGLALGNAEATQVEPVSGITARALPHDALGRLIALADTRDPRAQTVLALAYLKGGYGVAPDTKAAKRWSLAAAEAGEPTAQYLVGALTDKQDAAKAFAWFEKAALRGNVKAMHNLAIAYAEGRGTPQDDGRAAAWFGRAAAQGYVDSEFDLAVLFERGQGVRQNRIAALKWYLIAAHAGDGPSKSRADQLKGEMPDFEAAEAETMAENFKAQPRDFAANATASL
jgi:localization factor PodJL